jgi:NDP-sugar pyrophosphorylase family protein
VTEPMKPPAPVTAIALSVTLPVVDITDPVARATAYRRGPTAGGGPAPSSDPGGPASSEPPVAVVMAGGAGLRMRAGGETAPKPLVRILGAPLIERNLFALLRAGVRDVRICVAAGDEAVARWEATRGARLAAAGGASVRLVTEEVPLGNCGGLARAVPDRAADSLLLFADNLCDLDLAKLHEHHRAAGADLTLAVHDEPFPVPYGLPDVEGDVVTGYREKPTMHLRVASGVNVVGPRARGLLRGPSGIAELVNACVAGGLRVVAHPHRARWVDVNEPTSRDRATAMVLSAPDAFETFWPGAPPSGGPPAPVVGTWLDDLDTSGAPVRIRSWGPIPPDLSAEGRARVDAWLTAAGTPTFDRPDDR